MGTGETKEGDRIKRFWSACRAMLPTGLVVGGAVLIAAGLAMISLPLGVIAAGVLATIIGVLMTLGGGGGA